MSYKTLLTLIGLLVIGVLLWYIGCNNPEPPQQPKTDAVYNKTVDSLKNLIADQVAVQQHYDMQIKELNDSIYVLNAVIAQNNLTINQIKAKRNEKVTAVSKFSSLDITKFLSDRYKDSIR